MLASNIARLQSTSSADLELFPVYAGLEARRKVGVFGSSLSGARIEDVDSCSTP